MRHIVIDTETTGLEPSQGHRIIEIGAVELINRNKTGKTFHYYLNPEREIDKGAIAVHGLTNEFLADKPSFEAIHQEFLTFIKGSELIIHNAAFDIGFLNSELERLSKKSLGKIADYCSVLCTLILARKRHPGQKNNLDALCKRYAIDNSKRERHGALLDAEILAGVYLAMTGGQASLFESTQAVANEANIAVPLQNIMADSASHEFKIIPATATELAEHAAYVTRLQEKSGVKLWEDAKG